MISILYSDDFLDHRTGNAHPEKPGRVTAIIHAFKAAPWADQLDWRSPTPVEQQGNRLTQALYAIHP
nr:histone deacetylase [Oculatellaceae cyanobacterium Prado106]